MSTQSDLTLFDLFRSGQVDRCLCDQSCESFNTGQNKTISNRNIAQIATAGPTGIAALLKIKWLEFVTVYRNEQFRCWIGQVIRCLCNQSCESLNTGRNKTISNRNIAQITTTGPTGTDNIG